MPSTSGLTLTRPYRVELKTSLKHLIGAPPTVGCLVQQQTTDLWSLKGSQLSFRRILALISPLSEIPL
jgi:hypothetical protein